MGVYVCAWERRCCQPAFVCVSAHVSLFKHHMLVILCRRTYSAEQNLVTLLVHCHIYRASIRPQPLWPPPCHPFVFSSSVTSLVLQVYGWTAVKEGIPALEPTSLSGYRESLYCRSVCNVSAHIQDVVWATYSVDFFKGCHSVSVDYRDFPTDICLSLHTTSLARRHITE